MEYKSKNSKVERKTTMGNENKKKSFFETMKESIPPDKKQSGISFINTPDEVLALCAIAEELHGLNEKLEKITTIEGRAVRVLVRNPEGIKV